MSAFQTYYEQLHLGHQPLPPVPRPRPRPPCMPTTNLLPPAFADDEWFQLYPEVAPSAEEVLEPGPAPIRQAKPKQERQTPLRSLKQGLLENLSSYQIYAERLRKWDRDSYKLFQRIGMYVLPQTMVAHGSQLEPAVLRAPPAFGAVAMDLGARGSKEWVPARFIYFRKLDRPGHDIQRRGGGIVYRCHVYWDDNEAKVIEKMGGHGIGKDYAVHVAPDGTVTALRMLVSQPQTIRHRHGRDRGYQTTVVHQRWALPETDERNGVAPADWIVFLFCTTMNFWATAAQGSMIRVTATKGAMVMPFVVDVLKTPEFFSDRDPVIIDGRKKRIFHLVRGHTRQTAAGERHIKTHFSGLRQFTWNGYDITITVPGRDHADIAELTVGALEDLPPDEAAAPRYIEMNEVADIVADLIGSPEVAA